MIEEIFFICGVICLVIAVFGLVFAISIFQANAVTNDPAANCLIYEFPYIQWCKQQEINDFMDKFNEWSLNRTK